MRNEKGHQAFERALFQWLREQRRKILDFQFVLPGNVDHMVWVDHRRCFVLSLNDSDYTVYFNADFLELSCVEMEVRLSSWIRSR